MLPRKSRSRYPQWRINLFKNRPKTERSEPDPGVIRDFPKSTFAGDSVAEEGRSIAENDAIQQEHRE